MRSSQNSWWCAQGDCRLDARQIRRTDSGPLAFAHASEGHILPFMEVLCDRVRATIRPVLWGDQFRRTDELFGRALARVMAHELYHILGRRAGTATQGLPGTRCRVRS